jgi:glutamate/tyrosine decarboxylase-like PLP-dependent enzyme
MLTKVDPLLPDNTALFPLPADRLDVEQQLCLMLADARERIAEGRVTPTRDLESFNEELADFDFLSAMPLLSLAAWTIARLETGLVQLNHPRYLGLFNPGPSFASQCADRIAATFNPQLAAAATSPAAVAIEAHVIRAVAKRAGLPLQSTGHFTSGGSEANATAVICALTHAAPEFSSHGSRAFAGQPVFYISQDSHLAWVKIAHQTGIGRSAARMIPTDGSGRMDAGALNAAIEADRRANAIPFMVAATAGSTNAGMIDPLIPCAEIAAREKLWFHVDAAWGGGLIASERYRPLLAGIEKADSVTIDAHKWFATTMGCGMFLTTKPEILPATFNVYANFMPTHAPEADPYVNSMQWSRRFLGLRLFFSLASAGWAGHGAHIERGFVLIGQLNSELARRGWSVLNGNEALAVACLLPPPGSKPVREIVRNVLRSGSAWVSAASFEGNEVIRACITNGETTPEDISQVVAALESARIAR